MKKPFDIDAFSDLPNSLKPSDYVDLLLFLSSHKPVVRLGKNSAELYSITAEWCKRHLFKYYVSAAGYMYVSRHMILPYITSVVDDLPFPHATLLGKLLGYPSCCIHKIKILGESRIDEWEQAEFSDESLIGEYTLIDPRLYRKGAALISHVPCSNKCVASLRLAQNVLSIIVEHRNHKCMQRWAWVFNQ